MKISYKTIRVNKLNLEDIRKLQLRRLEFADKENQEKLKINEFKFYLGNLEVLNSLNLL